MISYPLKNTNEFPNAIQPILTEFTNKLLALLQDTHRISQDLNDNVISILVYGSAAGVNYNPKISNINIAVIVKELDFTFLKQAVNLVKWGSKHKIATPLFFTKDYVLNALDVFPIEFTEIKEQHRVIFGEDFFGSLEIPVKDVRLLCEQQIKGKLLRLRQDYVSVGPNVPILKKMLISVLSDLMPVFRQLIVLKGQKPLEFREEMLVQLAKIFSLDQEPFIVIYQDKHKKDTIAAHQVESYLQNFILQLENLARFLDS